MLDIISELSAKFEAELSNIKNSEELENIRVSYLGKKGSVTAAMKEMGKLSAEEKKEFGQKINVLKNSVADKIAEKKEELAALELQKEIDKVPEFDISLPEHFDQGSYHPITLVQRQCETIFKSMGFTVEDYSEVVTDYECFESVNIPKYHPARDMQDTYYLENGQLLKSQTTAAQNAIYKKYRKQLLENGTPIKAIFPGRCFRNEATDACHENTFFQMEGVMVGKDISISNLIYFMKTMLSEVFRRDIKVRLRPGFFPLWSLASSLISTVLTVAVRVALHVSTQAGLSFAHAVWFIQRFLRRAVSTQRSTQASLSALALQDLQ